MLFNITPGLSIKYVRSDLVILDTLPPCTCTYAFSLHPLPPNTILWIVFFKIWQRYILRITINQRITNNVTKIKKLLYKAIGKHLIKTPKRPLGSSLRFLTEPPPSPHTSQYTFTWTSLLPQPSERMYYMDDPPLQYQAKYIFVVVTASQPHAIWQTFHSFLKFSCYFIYFIFKLYDTRTRKKFVTLHSAPCDKSYNWMMK